MADATEVWAQGWSEPGAGSDLAALRSRADRVDGGWRLSGQKTWSTRAAFADWMFGLFRSEPGSSRHHGLTYFLVPLSAAGVTVRPVRQLDGEPGFAEVFFDEVFVPDDQVLGAVGQGWRIAMSTTTSERGLTLRSPGRFCATAQRLVELYRVVASDRPAAAAAARDDVVDGWMGAEAYRLYVLDAAVRAMSRLPGRGGVQRQQAVLVGARHRPPSDRACLARASGRLSLSDAARRAWLDGYQFALAGPIYAGTNEVQRNLVAERVLGLPRG